MTKEYSNVFTTLGATNHSEDTREENDYYATNPRTLELLLEKENFNETIWECAAGGHHLADVLKANGYEVITSDIKEYDRKHHFLCDFINERGPLFDKGVDILTNPPYKYALEFVKRALDTIHRGDRVCMFLRIAFLEGQERYEFFKKNPPQKIYVLSNRFACGKNGEFYEKDNNGNYVLNKNGSKKRIGSAICYAWFIWKKGYKGKTKIDWLIDHE